MKTFLGLSKRGLEEQFWAVRKVVFCKRNNKGTKKGCGVGMGLDNLGLLINGMDNGQP